MRAGVSGSLVRDEYGMRSCLCGKQSGMCAGSCRHATSESQRAEQVRRRPGVGLLAHIAGLERPDSPHRGVFRIIDDEESAAKLCSALTA